MKKARKHLEDRDVPYDFVDFKKQPPTEKDIQRWKAFVKDWPVNARGPTFRKIREKFEKANDAEKMRMLIENSSAIKRPILERDGKVVSVGFDPERFVSI